MGGIDQVISYSQCWTTFALKPSRIKHQKLSKQRFFGDKNEYPFEY